MASARKTHDRHAAPTPPVSVTHSPALPPCAPQATAEGIAKLHGLAAGLLCDTQGYEVKMEDGLILASFNRPLDAVIFALRLQEMCVSLDWCVRWGPAWLSLGGAVMSSCPTYACQPELCCMLQK
jgi:hypothetical protein